MEQSHLTKVQLFESDGVMIPSRIGSYLVWRELHKGHLKATPRDENGLCKICGGFQMIDTENYGRLWCLCYINDQTIALSRSLSRYESALTPRTFEELQPIKGTVLQVRAFWGIVETAQKFAKEPREWLTMMGSPGVGKTHLMSAIKHSFGPWALYITASDFESMVFQGLQDDSLNVMIENVRKAPILLFDDLGSEYVKDGRDFVRSNLRKIIDYRYKMPQEYPTVIATNLSPDALKAYDPRIYDRILDESLVSYANMLFPSWRTQGVGKHADSK